MATAAAVLVLLSVGNWISSAGIIRTEDNQFGGTGCNISTQVRKVSKMNSDHGSSPCWKNSSIPTNSENCPQRRQVSVFYFVTTVIGMIVLALFTLLFLFCLFLKWRRVSLRHSSRPSSNQRASETTVTFYSATEPHPNDENSGTSAADSNNTSTKTIADGAAPFTCVIMAGESQPTFIAKPIPSSTLVAGTANGSQETDMNSSRQADVKPSL